MNNDVMIGRKSVKFGARLSEQPIKTEYDCKWEKYAWKRMVLRDKRSYQIPKDAIEKGDEWNMQSLTRQVFFETLFNLWTEHYNKMKSKKWFGCFLLFFDERGRYKVNCIFV
ncbi:hypothetical protein Y032_0015g2863 [Ancylostoma ceylanicum]|uniref:Uncharacterized protein n=1 Tax=Ancylostoma ceylanicum TaxID=53326 RepID=A0A016V9Z5_9BILA|nr:hypothetical protein Y032_0015g2863 [Ancylostoma ceylanicum]